MKISGGVKAIGGLLLVSVLSAQANSASHLIDFDASRFSGDGETVEADNSIVPVEGGNSISTDGFSFTALGMGGNYIAIDDLRGKVGDGSARLYAINDVQVRLTTIDGRPFSLLGFDFGGSWRDWDKRIRWADAIEVTGFRIDGSPVGAVLDLDPTVDLTGPTSGLSPTSFGGQFQNMREVFFRGLGDTSLGRNNHEFVMDNLVVSSVPEPEAYALVLAGLGMLAWRCRQMRA